MSIGKCRVVAGYNEICGGCIVSDVPKDTASQRTGPDSVAQSENHADSELEAKVKESLREVYDPELGMSVMELGLIRKFDWTPENVEITMILTTPFCPYGPALIEQVREKAQEVSQRVA